MQGMLTVEEISPIIHPHFPATTGLNSDDEHRHYHDKSRTLENVPNPYPGMIARESFSWWR